MPRRLPALILFVALTVAAVAPLVVPPAAPAARAQGGAPPGFVVTLFATTVEFRSQPTTVILAELTHPDGSKVTGQGISDAAGHGFIQFFAYPGQTGSPVIRPGDRLRLARINDRPVIIDVPNLTADVDVAADRVVGTAPPGTAVVIDLTYGVETTTSISRTVTADGGGALRLDLAGTVDLVPGAVVGRAAYTTAEGYQFVAAFAALEADVTLGSRALRGSGTPGTTLSLLVRKVDGTTVLQRQMEVTESPDWVLAVASAYDPRPGLDLQAGDRVELTKAGGPLAISTTVGVTLTDLVLEMDAVRDRVNGVAAPDASLVIEAVSLAGERVRQAVTAAPDGTFGVDLAGVADLGPGWRVRASWQVEPELWVGRSEVAPQAYIGVHTAGVRGLAPPGQPLTVTLRAATGEDKAVAVTRPDDQGVFDIRLGDFVLFDQAVTIEPSDLIEVAFVAGDPLVVQVPSLTAQADVAADTVTGTAPAGASVRVTVLSDPTGPSVTVVADRNGSYRADFSGRHDLRRPANGSITVDAGGSAILFTTWSVPQLNIELGQNFVIANGAPGRAYVLRVVGPDGKVVAEARGTAFETAGMSGVLILGALQGTIYAFFTDTTDTAVPIAPGDTVEIRSGDDTASLNVPPLEAVVFVDDDVVTGRTAPGTSLAIDVEAASGERLTVTATADERGTFAHDFGGAFDLKYNDSVRLRAEVDGHTVASQLAVPGIDLDLDTSTLGGRVEPDTAVNVSLHRAGQTVAQVTTRSGADGAFYARLVDGAGAPLSVAIGDELRVVPMVAGGVAMVLTVPELSIEADIETDVIRGRATPGGTLVLLTMREVIDLSGLPLSQAWPTIGADGNWVADPVPTHDVRGGTIVRGQYRLPVGHIVRRSFFVPLLGVEHGGPNICGFGTPRRDVAATLHDADDRTLASAAGRTGGDGMYQMVLRDTSEQMVTTAMSQTVRAVLTGLPAEMTLPELTLNVDWESSSITGSGPPGRLVLVLYPARRCTSFFAEPTLNIAAGVAQTLPDGRLFGSVPLTMPPGEGFEIAFDRPDGHRFYRQVYRLLGRVYVDGDRITGVTNSAAAVSVTLQSAAGADIAHVDGRADQDGEFDLRLPAGTGGEPVIIRPGDVVRIDAAGDRAAITVEPLSFDWSPRNPVIGQAPAGRSVTLSLRVRDGRVLSLERPVDSRGTFSFGAEDVPPRATWDLDDIVAVRAALPTAGGHHIVSQTEDFEGPLRPAMTSIYLPVGLRKAAIGGGSSGLAAAAIPATAGARWVTSERRATAADALDIDPATRFENAVRWGWWRSLASVATAGGA